MTVHFTGSSLPHTQVFEGRQHRVHRVRPTSSAQVFLECIPFGECVVVMHQHVISCESRLCFVDDRVVQDKSTPETVNGKETISCQTLADFDFVSRHTTHCRLVLQLFQNTVVVLLSL
jgi:hypothetical protein